MTGSSERARLERLVAAFAEEHLVAIGWGTVELDRAISQLASALGVAPAAFAAAPDSQALGAWCRVAPHALAAFDGLTVVVLEPSTEGRLAATLARHDEGPCAVWLAAGSVPRDVTDVAPTDGPFGPEHLLDGPRHGPHRLLLMRPGTIPP